MTTDRDAIVNHLRNVLRDREITPEMGFRLLDAVDKLLAELPELWGEQVRGGYIALAVPVAVIDEMQAARRDIYRRRD